jgi:nitrate/nitrite transport system substrate-binding protein
MVGDCRQHKDRRDPKSWKGLKFDVRSEFSMHIYLLRYYGERVDPDQDLQIAAVPPTSSSVVA